ncbi:MAG: rubrerythrin [Bacteroidetes bacterium GWF2_38_335]|nr:MAG: rubrerythrin [Bacteroidetes bacterium GWF2_38_335]OFY80255.1 MAG: rubrerythrin [Bacteroidetes bacterium RIFOXYA12_FULL_38_20]HBS88712.1 rubrerythrin family protein [Bacteroidales bacterium]
MSKLIKGTQTEINLLKSFAGESQARNRYTFFAEQAEEEGFIQIANVFLETSEQEFAHAHRFFEFLKGGGVEIKAMYPAGVIGDTAENLKASAEGEHEEWSVLYPAFAEIANEEGFKDVATAFKMIAKVEEEHEKRYRAFLENIEKNRVFEREDKVKWECSNCGYVHIGKKALENCPACLFPKDFFQLKAENW